MIVHFMKKALLVLIMTVSVSQITYTQEWLTSLEVAKELALIQDKMILALWENAAFNGFPYLSQKNNKISVTDIVTGKAHQRIIWKYFVPVIIPEYRYEDLIKDVEGKRNSNYIQKFNDNSIKIMDANGNILDTDSFLYNLNNSSFATLITKYALNTKYLRQELKSYSFNRNFITTFRLASKYLDFAIYANKPLKKEIVDLSDVYMKEAIEKLEEEQPLNKEAYFQKIKLLEIKKYIVLNNPKKALKILKKFEGSDIDSINKPLLAFLNFASNRLLNNIDNAMVWQNDVLLVDLKKIKYLLK